MQWNRDYQIVFSVAERQLIAQTFGQRMRER